MNLLFSGHVLQRMTERSIHPRVVRSVVETGLVLMEYPEDRPFPSRLVLGWEGSRPVHVVYAEDKDSDLKYIITVYEPDPDLWIHGFTRRKA
jgi:hypothetical protein